MLHVGFLGLELILGSFHGAQAVVCLGQLALLIVHLVLTYVQIQLLRLGRRAGLLRCFLLHIDWVVANFLLAGWRKIDAFALERTVGGNQLRFRSSWVLAGLFLRRREARLLAVNLVDDLEVDHLRHSLDDVVFLQGDLFDLGFACSLAVELVQVGEVDVRLVHLAEVEPALLVLKTDAHSLGRVDEGGQLLALLDELLHVWVFRHFHVEDLLSVFRVVGLALLDSRNLLLELRNALYLFYRALAVVPLLMVPLLLVYHEIARRN